MSETTTEHAAADHATLDEAIAAAEEGYATLERMSEANVRVDQLFHIATMMTDGVMSHELLTLLTGWQTTELVEAWGWPEGLDSSEYICERLVDESRYGWLAEVHAPLPRFTEGGSEFFSWGHCLTEVLYADTYPKLVDAAIEWAERMRTEARERWQAKRVEQTDG